MVCPTKIDKISLKFYIKKINWWINHSSNWYPNYICINPSISYPCSVKYCDWLLAEYTFQTWLSIGTLDYWIESSLNCRIIVALVVQPTIDSGIHCCHCCPPLCLAVCVCRPSLIPSAQQWTAVQCSGIVSIFEHSYDKQHFSRHYCLICTFGHCLAQLIKIIEHYWTLLNIDKLAIN